MTPRRALLFLIPAFICGCDHSYDRGRAGTPQPTSAPAVSTASTSTIPDPLKPTIVSSERFGDLRIFRKKSEPSKAAVLFSGNVGWLPVDESLARDLAAKDVIVIGVDSKTYLASLEADDEDCDYIAGEILRLVQSAEKGAGASSFVPAVLVGFSKGSNIALTSFLQHPGTFVGAVSIDAQPAFSKGFHPCLEGDLKLTTPASPTAIPEVIVPEELKERILSGPPEQVTGKLEEVWSKGNPEKEPALLPDLPLEIVEPDDDAAENQFTDLFAVFISGDGGWATLDDEISKRLAAQNIPVVGISSLDYFWKQKTAEQGAADLKRIIQTYSNEWGRHKVLLLGFSFGADVAAFWHNVLPPETKSLVRQLVLLSPGIETDFEIHISDWLGFDDVQNGADIEPELLKAAPTPVLCIYGESEEDDTVCNVAKAANVKALRFPGDHHFNGDYDGVVEAIVKTLRERKKL